MTEQTITSRHRANIVSDFLGVLGPLVLALLLTTLALIGVGADPLRAYATMWQGAFGNAEKFSSVLDAWVPLVLCSVGLLITFTAGLWNIGIEGQIVLGAIAATWVARTFDWPAEILLPLMFLAGALGGAAWALLAGALKVYGRVHEIFGGLGLNFVAMGLALYLIIGPWKRAGIASTSGTEPFRPAALLPNFPGLSIGPIELVLASVALLLVYLALRGTLWGLQLKALGKNIRAAFWLGIPTQRHLLGAFVLCGICAGLAGAEQASGVWGRLIPSISGGYGYLSILVVLLSGFTAPPVPLVAFFFAAVTKGSIALPLDLQIDSALGGVLQGVVVLLFVLSQGVRSRIRRSSDSIQSPNHLITK